MNGWVEGSERGKEGRKEERKEGGREGGRNCLTWWLKVQNPFGKPSRLEIQVNAESTKQARPTDWKEAEFLCCTLELEFLLLQKLQSSVIGLQLIG